MDNFLHLIYFANHYLSNQLAMISDKYSSNKELIEHISICESFCNDIYNLLRSHGYGK